METYFEALKAYIEAHPPNFGDGESVLTMLYEYHNENSPYDNEQIKVDFNELYQQINGRWIRSSIQSVSSAGITRDLVLWKVLKLACV